MSLCAGHLGRLDIFRLCRRSSLSNQLIRSNVITKSDDEPTLFTSVGNSANSRGLADVTPCIATPNVAVERPPGGEAARVPVGAREHHAWCLGTASIVAHAW